MYTEAMDSSQKIEAFIQDYPDWRGQKLAELRQLILETNPNFKQEFKWGVPIFSLNKMVLGISAFKSHIKINFLQGAQIADPEGLFNSGLDSKQHRSINLTEGESINRDALKRLILAAIEYDKTSANSEN